MNVNSEYLTSTFPPLSKSQTAFTFNLSKLKDRNPTWRKRDAHCNRRFVHSPFLERTPSLPLSPPLKIQRSRANVPLKYLTPMLGAKERIPMGPHHIAICIHQSGIARPLRVPSLQAPGFLLRFISKTRSVICLGL